MTQNAINNRASQMSIGDILISGDTIATQTVNQNLIIAPNGTGVTNIANGITFDGTHVLTKYIGSTPFTPVLNFGGSPTGITYSRQQGNYLRIGDLVYIEISLILTSKGAGAGEATITGLPLPELFASFLPTRWEFVQLIPNYTQFVAQTNISTIFLQQVGNNVGTSGIDISLFANNSTIFISGTYLTNP